jgi:23S rRNA (guanosine2251-2'-O)-methyltransferase
MKEQRNDMLIGRNPVTEALKSGREIERLVVQKGAGGSIGKILSMARNKGIVVHYQEKELLDKKAGGGKHQGVIAYVAAHSYASMEDIFSLAEQRGEAPFIMVLDELEDPHNLGAIMRTAECAGAHGVIISKRRAGGLTDTVAKASAGAVEYLPCVRVTNIARSIEELQKRGVWVYACDMDGTDYREQDMKGPAALVIGNEGAGISRLVKEKCDFVVSIPMVGRISSLNASNAAAILMYEIRRQRDGR